MLFTLLPISCHFHCNGIGVWCHMDGPMQLLLSHIWLLNTLRPNQDGRHFPDEIFLKENVWISTNIWLKFVPKGPIDNILELVQIMAWRRPGAKPLYESMMVSLPTHISVARPQWIKAVLSIDHMIKPTAIDSWGYTPPTTIHAIML